MRLPRLAARLYGVPLLVTSERFAVIERVFRSLNVDGAKADPITAEALEDERHAIDLQNGTLTRSRGGYLMSDAGVAIVPVIGTLVQRADGIDAQSGLLGYNRIGAQFRAAMADDTVEAVLLEIDSPGGEVNGLFQLAETIASAQKPVWAIANEEAFSAAYAIASQASQLWVPETGMVGSVGVLMTHVDQSKLDQSIGLDYTYIFAGKKKVDGNPHEPLSKRARQDAQDEVDRIYDIFVKAVASGRNIDPQAVRDTEAGLLNPKDAKAGGFIDGIASFSDTLAALGNEVSRASRGTRAAATGAIRSTSMESHNMANADGNAPVQPAAQSTITAEQLAQARADGIAEGQRQAAAAERTRIAAITGSEEAEGRTELAQHLAHGTDMSAEAARAILAKAPKAAPAAAATNALANAMAGVPNPNVGADASSGGGSDETEEDVARRIAGGYKSTRTDLYAVKK